MDFALSPEHEMIRKTVRDFAEKEIRPIIKECDRQHAFDRSLLPKMAAVGLLGICIPVRYGSAGSEKRNCGN